MRSEKYQGGEVIIGRDVEGIKHVNFQGKNGVGRGTIFTGEVQMGFGTTISANCYIVGPVEIGRYTQIGANVGIIGQNHPQTYLSIYINQALFQGRLASHQEIAKIMIGHDVWIGQGVIILSGVNIGNGAIIGAGAVVTKSIPDFAVAVGNPAKVIRYRFIPEVIEILKDFHWWNKRPEELNEIETLFHFDFSHDPENLIKLLQKTIYEYKEKRS
jgi:acetyltransferase-like isoleucine patch superfamily enzyme